ncbi:hypothetical protein Tco_1336804 [Tanacetum coccineum]
MKGSLYSILQSQRFHLPEQRKKEQIDGVMKYQSSVRGSLNDVRTALDDRLKGIRMKHRYSNPMIQPEPEGSTQGYPLDSVEVLRYDTKGEKVDPHGFEGTCKDGDGDILHSLLLKLASFKSSSYFLQEMIDNQRSLKDRHGLGFTEDIASTSKTKIEKLGPVDKETSTVELAVPVPSAREPTSSNEGNRTSIVESEILVSNVRLKVKLELDEWIKDSGCSRHMTGNKDLFSTYKAIDGGNMVFGSNTKSKIIKKGTITHNSLTIHDVSNVENLSFNLLSI